MSTRNTVVLLIWSRRAPAPSTRPRRLSSACRSWASEPVGEPVGREADLPRDDQPVPRADDGRVRADRRAHGANPTPVGHAGGRPWCRHTAAATDANTASLPATAGPSSRPDVTTTGGMSAARRMPNERIVRSSTSPSIVDREPLGGHPAERHVGRADAVAAQHHLVEHLAARHARPRAGHLGWRSGAMAPDGEVTIVSPRTAADRTAASTHPAPRIRADVGGPTTSTSSTTRPDPAESMAAAIPAVRATRMTPVPSARTPAAIGGRFGPDRTTSSRVHRATTARPNRSASSRAAAGRGLSTLPPKAPPLARTVDGSPPGSHQDDVDLEIGGLDPARAECHRPVAVRHVDRVAAVAPSCAGPGRGLPPPAPR